MNASPSVTTVMGLRRGRGGMRIGRGSGLIGTRLRVLLLILIRRVVRGRRCSGRGRVRARRTLLDVGLSTDVRPLAGVDLANRLANTTGWVARFGVAGSASKMLPFLLNKCLRSLLLFLESLLQTHSLQSRPVNPAGQFLQTTCPSASK